MRTTMTTTVGWLFLGSVAGSWDAAAQSCPDNAPLYCAEGDFCCSSQSEGCCSNQNCGCCPPDADCCDESGCCAVCGSPDPDPAPPPPEAVCPPGTYECSEDFCTPDGGVCCASVGRPESFCPGGTSCTEGGCSDGSPAEDAPISSGGSSDAGGGFSCTSTGSSGGCEDLQACADGEGAWYDADGRIFVCEGDCGPAAAEALDYCESLDRGPLGCSTSRGQSAVVPGAALLALALLRRRRRRARLSSGV